VNDCTVPDLSSESFSGANSDAESEEETEEPATKRIRTVSETTASVTGSGHNMVEKKRRAYLSQCYSYLQRAVPALTLSRASNVKILRGSLHFIKALEAEERRLLAEKARQRHIYESLVQRQQQAPPSSPLQAPPSSSLQAASPLTNLIGRPRRTSTPSPKALAMASLKVLAMPSPKALGIARGPKSPSPIKAPVVPQNIFYVSPTNLPTIMELDSNPTRKRETVASPSKMFLNASVSSNKTDLRRRASSVDSEEVAMSLMLLAEMFA